MRIGELARRAGCQAETVRYYEREGLLPAPGRTDGNYRFYDAAHLARLTFIRNCRTLEMSLAEIRALLAIKDGAGRDCGEVNAVLEAHIGHVAERMDRLGALRDQLAALREQCGGLDSVERCGILRGLEQGEPCGAGDSHASAAACPLGRGQPGGPACPAGGGGVCGRKR